MITLFWVALVLAPQEEFPFPVFERDPWGGFGAGSSVVRLTVVGKIRTEETITLKAVDKDSKTITVSKPGADDQEETVKFIPFSDTLIARGLKQSGKSGKQVSIGDRKVKALIREFIPDAIALDITRLTSADEMPGGIVDLTWKMEDDLVKYDVTYGFKGMDPVKIGGQSFGAAKIDLTFVETKKKKRKIEATLWISEAVPGFLARSRIKDTVDKVTTETSMDVVKVEVKKP
jgi:hypothetical protein